MSVPAQRLGLSEAVGLSLSMMAPTMAMAINVSLAVRAEGRAAPMAFAIGTFLLTIIALSFVSFGRRVAHAGSVYAYIGEACGRRLGFIAGWTLLLTYLSYASGCSALIGNFVGVAAQNYGAKNPTAVGLCGLLIATVLAFRDMRVAGRFMLALEAVSVLAIVLLCLVVLANVARTSGLCPAPFRPRRKQRLVRHRICNCLQYPFLRWFRRRCDLGRRATEPASQYPRGHSGYLRSCCSLTSSWPTQKWWVLDWRHERSGCRHCAAGRPCDQVLLKELRAIDLAAAVSGFACALGSLSAAARLLKGSCADSTPMAPLRW